MIEQVTPSLTYPVYEAKQVREGECKIARLLNIPMYDLMELAGLASFNVFKQEWPEASTILVLCGNGNNAGDGFVFARIAREQGMTVFVRTIDAEPSYSGDAGMAFSRLNAIDCDVNFFDKDEAFSVEVVVDALLGTGVTTQLRPQFLTCVQWINAQSNNVLSIDIPSGICAETGAVLGEAVNANITVTFVALKPGLLTSAGKGKSGRLYFDGLTIDSTFNQQIPSQITLVGQPIIQNLPKREFTAHKGQSGRVLIVGGNKGMPGASRLAAEASLRAGAGLVKVKCHHANVTVVASARPELMFYRDDDEFMPDSMVIGPGLGRDEWAFEQWQKFKSFNCVKIIDADALHILSQYPENRSDWVLTPHFGEAAKLLDCDVKCIEEHPINAAKNIQRRYGGTCILKGPGSLICTQKRVFINNSGNAGMASGGMGDVLSGIIASIINQVSDYGKAAAISVYIHGLAADRVATETGAKGMLASDLFKDIQRLVN